MYSLGVGWTHANSGEEDLMHAEFNTLYLQVLFCQYATQI